MIKFQFVIFQIILFISVIGKHKFLFPEYNVSLFISSSKSEDLGYSLLYEGESCCQTTFDSSLNWYGIYETAQGDSMLKVQMFQDTVTGYDGHLWNKIYTDQSRVRQAKYLLGSKFTLNEKLLNSGTNSYPHRGFLFPGQRANVYSILRPGIAAECVTLIATGSVKSIGYCPELENYRIMISNTQTYEILQDLTSEFDFKGECGMFELVWFGDIDEDQKPDMIFSASNNAEGLETLFLTSVAEKGTYIKKVTSAYSCDCT